MNSYIKTIKNKVGFIGAVIVAALVGGLTSAVVLAAIPDSGGVIHGCYKNSTGMLKVIDTSTTTNCASGETSLNWNQNGSAATVLHDANGQILGELTDMGDLSAGNSTVNIYNRSINRVMPISFNSTTSQFDIGIVNAPVFASSDCTGQPYDQNSFTPTSKLRLSRWNNGSSNIYAIVSDNATKSTINVNSVLNTSDNETFYCQAVSYTDDIYPFTVVPLPFNTPIATPFKF
jgi:hypothetical protein